MSGQKQNVTTTMVVEKPKKELSLEEKKAALEKELEEKAAEKAQLDADIAEQKRKKAEQAAADLAEKIRKAKEEQVFLLEQSKEADDKLKKLMAQTVQGNSDTTPAPDKSDFIPEVQEMIDAGRESQIVAGEVAPKEIEFDNGSTIVLGESKPIEDFKGYNPDNFINEEYEFSNRHQYEYDKERGVYNHTTDEPAETPSFWGKLKAALRKSLTSLQVIVMLLFLGLSWGGFKYYEWKIDKFNASLNNEELLTQKINAYNDSNIQRMFFEAGNIGVKMIIALIMLFVLNPSAAGYIVPFWKSKVSFIEDFNNQQPWQRQLNVSIIVFGILLFLGLSAVVNTY